MNKTKSVKNPIIKINNNTKINIANMSITQLKAELEKCNEDDITKKTLLRKLIKQKILINTKKQDVVTFVDPLDELIKCNNLSDNHCEDQSDVYMPVSIDNKFKGEIEKDVANNKLMERLNGELDFRTNGQNKKTFAKPYFESEISNAYSPYNTKEQTATINQLVTHAIPTNDFSTKRVLGRRRIDS